MFYNFCRKYIELSYVKIGVSVYEEYGFKLDYVIVIYLVKSIDDMLFYDKYLRL